MSRGTSYLAAYRMTQANEMNRAYKEALMEIKNAQAQATAYQSIINDIDEQILEYAKLKQKLVDADSPTVKNEILQAEIAFAQINERNNSNKINVYRFADEEFDAPLRTESEIAQNSAGRNTFYNTTAIGNLPAYIQSNHAAIFTGLSKNQKRDAANMLYDTIIREGNAAMGGLTTQQKKDIRNAIVATSGVPLSEFGSAFHQAEKQKYIQNVMSQVTGPTGSLRNAINEAKGDGGAALNAKDQVLRNVALVSAVDGFDKSDENILRGAMSEIYGNKVVSGEFTIDGKKVKNPKYSQLTKEDQDKYLKTQQMPTTIDELFARRSIAADPLVVQARRTGQELSRIAKKTSELETERKAAVTSRDTRLQDVARLQTPENLRERQAEIFAQTLSPAQRQRLLTPEQQKRVAALEKSATTTAQRATEAGQAEIDRQMFDQYTPEQINTLRAMANAVAAQQSGQDIPMDVLEEDSYLALKEQLDSNNISKQDIYKKAQQLGQQMSPLADSQRNFAQTVASRIYLDLYNDLQAQMPAVGINTQNNRQNNRGSNLPPEDTFKGEAPQEGEVLPEREQ